MKLFKINFKKNLKGFKVFNISYQIVTKIVASFSCSQKFLVTQISPLTLTEDPQNYRSFF